jgi:membrane protein YdbS with pleckstrin-like domain
VSQPATSSYHHDRAEPVLWSGYPSWRQFVWLYLMSALVAARALLFRRFDVPGWEAWLVGAGLLLVIAVILRRWACYEMTSDGLLIRNGYTGRVIAECAFSQVAGVDVRQGPVAAFLGIGTLVIRGSGNRLFRFRGLAHPHLLKQRIDQARRSSGTAQAAAVLRTG